ncbi:VTT domain-containing protein [uncultured Microbacterium sp.]|uniref:VTT domain-containing protein n=1 Tax=uncultured Microbacterium sp. TaxID=191216 RepID=UPI0028E9D655|nr:VTT domain-containing protein [uncultured Microbacterium sp.]
MDLFHVLAGFGFFSLVLIALIVFVENGILFPFLPGDSLVFAGAIIAAAIGVHWSVVAGVAGAAAILGGEVGFTLGRRYGRQLFRSDARVLKRRYLVETERFFARWGAFAIVLARFVPIVRTYVAPAAGMSAMTRAAFTRWNIVSGVVWAGVLGLSGFLLGSIPWVAANIEWIMLGIVVVTVAPVAVTAVLGSRRDRRSARVESGS